MIIFTSDNGPADEYGADPRFFDSNGPFDGMKRDVYEGGMRVPAFVRWPGHIEPGQTDASPSQFHDWMATLADAAGAETPDECDGVSLLPRWKTSGGAPAKDAKPSLVYTQYEFPWGGGTEAFAEFEKRKGKDRVRGLQQMVRVGDYVALRTRMRDADGKINLDASRTRLYNVVSDPFEECDLSSRPEEAERIREMTAILDERLR